MKPRLVLAALMLPAMMLAAPMAQARPVLVELFTSQSCSSCPPADALLQQLAAKDKYILPLSMNVTYWNNTGWNDKDSMLTVTQRQIWYAGLFGSSNVYTPEAVVDGTSAVLGSDRNALTDAINMARWSLAKSVKITITNGAKMSFEVGAGDGTGQIFLFGYDAQHATPVQAGENAGKTITEINVVRSVTSLGPWVGLDEKFTLAHPAGTHIAVVLQAQNGAVLGVASQ